jgi:hypothetical protein
MRTGLAGYCCAHTIAGIAAASAADSNTNDERGMMQDEFMRAIGPLAIRPEGQSLRHLPRPRKNTGGVAVCSRCGSISAFSDRRKST